MMRRWMRWTIAVTLCAAAGCEPSTPPPVPPPPPPTAEETFHQIVTDLKNDLEPARDTGVVVFGGGGSRSTVRYSVSGRFVAPSGASTGPQGIVHVSVNSRYVAAAPPPAEAAEATEEDKSAGSGGPGDPEMVEGIDPELLAEVPLSPPPRRPQVDVPQRQATFSEAKDYDLKFTDGKWRLVSELDPEFESALQMAFERALKKQLPATE